MTDELLVVRAQLGERVALAELVARWRVPVWRYVQRMLDADRADDVTQEIWLAVVRGLPRLRDPARFTPWLFAIARRSVVDRLRTEYAREQETLVRDDMCVEDPGEAVAVRAELVGALTSLSVMEREVLVLHYLEDLSVQDCAQVCQVPVGTVQSYSRRPPLPQTACSACFCRTFQLLDGATSPIPLTPCVTPLCRARAADPGRAVAARRPGRARRV